MRTLHCFHENSCVSIGRPHLPCDLTEYCDGWDVLDILHWWNSLFWDKKTCSPISLPHFGRDFISRYFAWRSAITDTPRYVQCDATSSQIVWHTSTPLLTTFLTSIRSFCPFISLPKPSRLRIQEKEGIQYNKQNKSKTREENTKKKTNYKKIVYIKCKQNTSNTKQKSYIHLQQK